MTIEVAQEAVRAICTQQNGGVCKCMTEGGVGLGKVPAAVMCRDTYLEIWEALGPIFARYRQAAYEKGKQAGYEIGHADGTKMTTRRLAGLGGGL